MPGRPTKATILIKLFDDVDGSKGEEMRARMVGKRFVRRDGRIVVVDNEHREHKPRKPKPPRADGSSRP